jgi:hypothetical protein
VYIAAVRPAQPVPRMMTFSIVSKGGADNLPPLRPKSKPATAIFPPPRFMSPACFRSPVRHLTFSVYHLSFHPPGLPIPLCPFSFNLPTPA